VFCVYCVIIVFFSVNCVIYVCLQYFDTVGWVLRPVKNRRPYNLYCVGGDVKPCSINLVIYGSCYVSVVVVQVIDPVCHQLFDFYRSLNTQLQRFTLEFVPALLWSYMSLPYVTDKKVIFCSTITVSYCCLVVVCLSVCLSKLL